MGAIVGKSRKDSRPAMSKGDMEAISRATDIILQRSKRLGSVSKVKPVNNKIVLGCSYPKRQIILTTASEAMRMDVDKRWVESVSAQVARDRPDLVPGSEVEIDIKRWMMEANGLPAFIEETSTHTNKYYVVSPECVEFILNE